MLKTTVKNGVIAGTEDTCSTIEAARAETQLELMKSRDMYIKEMWAVMGYTCDMLQYARDNEAPTIVQQNYDKLIAECTKEYNRLLTMLNNATTNAEAYNVCWTALSEEHPAMVDNNSNGIWDMLDNLKFW